MSETKKRKIAVKSVLIALGIICIVLASGLVGALVYYVSLVNDKDSAISMLNSQIFQLTSNVTNLQNQVTDLQTQVNELLKDFSLYNNEFGNVSVVSPSHIFSPPVSIYRALRIALESDGWTASSLSNMTVSASLEYREFWSNDSSGGSGSVFLHDVTQPARDYSPVQVNGTTYRYVWDIVVEESVGVRSIPPPGLYWVDAATGEIVPHGPLL
jgi:cell division protein FtsB